METEILNKLKARLLPGSPFFFWGGGDCKETMTFQTTPHNHVGKCRQMFFTQLAGRELLGVVAIDRWGNHSQLHENAHAEMLAR